MFRPYLCLFHSTWFWACPHVYTSLPCSRPHTSKNTQALHPGLPTSPRWTSLYSVPLPPRLSALAPAFLLLEEGFPAGSDGEEFACNARDLGSSRGYSRRFSHDHGPSGLRSNGTFSHRTFQLRTPLSSIAPCYFPQSPCPSINFLLTHSPLLLLLE